MTATDIAYGRQGGRVMPWTIVGGAFVARCNCTRYIAVAANLGAKCWACGGVIRRVGAPA